MSPTHPIPSAMPSRLQQRIERITGEGFAFYEGHARAETRDALPHWIAALPALGKVNADYQEKPLMDYLIALLANPEESEWAVDTLGNMGRYAASALPALFDILGGEGIFESSNIKECVGKIGQAVPEKVVPVLIERLNDMTENNWVRMDTADVLSGIGKKASAAVPFLIGFLNDKTKNNSVREHSARALGVVGEQVECAVSTLIEHLNDETELKEFRMSLAIILGAIDRQANEAVPFLIECLNDKGDLAMRFLSAMALSKIGEKTNAIPFLIKCLHDIRENISLRLEVAKALGNFGETAHIALPFLIECLKDKTEDHRVRCSSARVLGAVGWQASESVPILIRYLNDKTENLPVRYEAAKALGAIGRQASESVPYLLRCLNDETEAFWLRKNSALALGNFTETAGEAVPFLVGYFNDKTENNDETENQIFPYQAFPFFRFHVAEALGKIQEKARLRIFLQDHSASAAGCIVYRAGELARGCRPFLPPPNPVPAVSPKLADLSDAELERE